MADRKVRLAALAAKAGRSKKAADEVEENDNAHAEEPTRAVSFRNYAPIDERLEPDGDHEEPSSKRPRKEEAKSALQKALEKAEREIATIVVDGDVTTMGPKKITEA
jgi:hypothetical protein